MSDQVIAIIFFVAIIALTLGITAWASRQTTDTSHHYVAGGEIKGWQNGRVWRRPCTVAGRPAWARGLRRDTTRWITRRTSSAIANGWRRLR